MYKSSVFNGIPYEIESSYVVEERPPVKVNRPVICTQVMSRSGFVTGFNLVTSPSELLNYFPDDMPHISLEKARIIMEAGFNLYVNNVYQPSGYITARIINSDNGEEIIVTPYDTNETVSSSVFNLDNYEDSVLKIDLSTVKPKDYFILEVNNETTKVQTNVMIWFHDKTKEEIENFVDAYGNKGEDPFIRDYIGLNIDQIYYAIGYGINVSQGAIVNDVIRLINKNPVGFYVMKGDISTELYIAHNKGFINIANHSDNIKISLDQNYIFKVLSKVKNDLKVLDIKSKYLTDNNEIALKISKVDDFVYDVKVCKLFNNKVLFYEKYTGCTDSNVAYLYKLPLLHEELNKSILIEVTNYKDTYFLPEGDFLLKSITNLNDSYFLNILKTKEISLFIEGLNTLNPSSDLKFNFYTDSHLNSLKYQRSLYFLLKPYDVFGFFVYRGISLTDEPLKLSYFSDQELYVNGKKYNTLDISLVLISNNYLASGVIDNAKNCTNTLFKENWVNYINSDTTITRKSLRGYDELGNLKDLRHCMIKSVFMKEISGSWDYSVTSIMESIQTTKKLFKDVFGVDIFLEMASCKNVTEKNHDGVEININYKVPDVKDFSKISLNLNVQ